MASSYAIDRDIPVPAAKRNGNRYPWRDMRVGDSILVPYGDKDRTQQLAQVSSAAAYGLGRGNYRCVKQDDGVRVWKLA